MTYEVASISAVPLADNDPSIERWSFICSCVINNELFLQGIRVERNCSEYPLFTYPQQKITPHAQAHYFLPRGYLKKLIESKLVQAISESKFVQP